MVVQLDRVVAVVEHLSRVEQLNRLKQQSTKPTITPSVVDISLSIIVPALNEEQNIEACLLGLQPLRKQGAEVILADGGSQDSTCELAVPFVDHLIKSSPGRGTQMNAGAAAAHGEHLLFLHADTILPVDFSPKLISEAPWGFFPVKLSGLAWPFRVIECAMNLRSKITKIATGDQAIFIRAELFQRVGGFADIPLMEDVEICGKLRSEFCPVLALGTVVTSSRRWEQQGIFKTVLCMWRLRLAFFFGACPHRLMRQYY